MSSPTQQPHQHQSLLICSICQSLGASLHYGVLTCSACMNFFRRTVTEGLQYQCQEGGGCVISGTENRTKCRQCRWLRCLQAGMRADGVSYQMPPPPPPPPPLPQPLPPPPRPQSYDMQLHHQPQNQCQQPQYSNPYLYHLSNIDIRLQQLSFSTRPKAASSAPHNRDVDAWLCLVESFVGELIRWCKDLSGFSNLRAADQSALVRANGTKLLCLQVVVNSLPYQGHLRFCSNFTLHQLNTNFCSRRLFKKLVSLCQYATDLRLGYSEMLLLRPIFFLDPPAHQQWCSLSQIKDLQSSFLGQLTKICPSQARREQLFLLNRELADCWKLILEHLESTLASTSAPMAS